MSALGRRPTHSAEQDFETMHDGTTEPTLAELRNELAEMRAALAESQARINSLEGKRPDLEIVADDRSEGIDIDEPRGRRGFFKLAAAGAAGVVVAGVATAQPAAATTGNAVIIGATNSPTNPGETTSLQNPGLTTLSDQLFQSRNFTDVISTPPTAKIGIWASTSGVDSVTQPRIGIYGRASGATLASSSGSQVGVFGSAGDGADDFSFGFPIGLLATVGGNGDAIHGIANPANSSSFGVVGESATGIGVVASSSSGTGLSASSSSGLAVSATSTTGVSGSFGGGGRIRQTLRAVGAPASGSFSAGEQIRDGLGDLFICTVSGTPGTWRRVVAQAPGFDYAGGSLNFLPNPIRVIDTRGGAPLGGGKFAADTTRTYQITGTAVLGVAVPTGASGIFANITCTNEVGAGDLRVFPANLVSTATSAVNFRAGVDIANTVITQLSPLGLLKIQCDANATDVILDINGFLF
jgi:hypothetical protein